MINRIRWVATAFACDVCKRSIKLPTNSFGINMVPNCSITQGCKGKLSPVSDTVDASTITSVAPEVANVTNWQPRQILQTHYQTVAADTWTVQYKLSGTPKLHVYTYDQSSNLVETVSYEWSLSNGIITLTFPGACSGIMQCVTASPTSSTQQTVATQTITSYQISSTAGDITIATLDVADQIGVTVTFLPQGNPTPIEYFNIPIGPSITSPWVNVGTAIIAGRKYRIRSFNVHSAASAVEYFSTGIISSGTPLYISHAGSKPVAAGSCLLLLGNAPYSFVDRIYDKIIDVSVVSTSQPQLFYSDGKVYSTDDLTKTTYPPILIV